ncbi:uncharacterized protein ACDP82_001197 [Pangshura tecta]
MGDHRTSEEVMTQVWLFRLAAHCCVCVLSSQINSLSGHPTVDTLFVSVPFEIGPSQEEAILDEDGEGDAEAEDDSEASDASCSQELFSTPEELSHSQQSDLGEAQIGEEAPEMTLGASPPSLLSPAERLRSIRMRQRRTKEDFLREVMMHSAAKKQELKEWWDSEKRDQKENAAHQKEASERLLNVMECQVEMLQAILALQTEQLRTRPSLQLLSQNSFPCTSPTLPTHSYQPPGSTLCPQHSTQSSSVDSQYPRHSTPVPLQFGPAEVQHPLHCIPKEKVGYDP